MVDKYIFWKPAYKKLENGKFILDKLNFDTLILFQLLFDSGFRRFDLSIDKYIFVRIEKNIVRKSSIVQMYDFVLDYINKLPEYLDSDNILTQNHVKSKFINQSNYYLSETKLAYLKGEKEIKINSDPANSAYVYYKNTVVEVSDIGLTLIPYDRINHYVFFDQIIQRNFEINDHYKQCITAKFFNFISYGENLELKPRLQHLKRLTGYLLHNYFNYKRKAVILTDSSLEFEEDEANGRSGKTLYSKMLQYFLNGYSSHFSGIGNTQDRKIAAEINGKNFDAYDKYRYSIAEVETRLIVINDLRKGFNIEMLYNDVSEYITVDVKNQIPFYIHSKLLLTTNKLIKIEGGSSKDRFLEFQFTSYFNNNYSPQDEFKQWMFTDWTSNEWNLFDNYFLSCLQDFFKHGLPSKIDQINLQTRKLYETTSPEFVDFIQNIWKPEFDKPYSKPAYFNEFLNYFADYKEGKNKLTEKKFHIWIVNYCLHSEEFAPFNKRFNTDQGESYQFRSKGNGVMMFVFKSRMKN